MRPRPGRRDRGPMRTQRTHAGPAAYPMVDEAEAIGLVAGTYALVLESFPMVPSLFKSLAVSPGYLALAWDQTRSVLDDDRFRAAARRLVADVDDAVPAPSGASERELLGRFVRGERCSG